MSDRFKQQGPFFLLVGLLLLLSSLILKDYLFGSATYLFKDIASDSINVFYPRMVQTHRLLHESGLPEWSFHQGLGHSAFDFLGDPTSWLYYLGSEEGIATRLAWVEWLKLILTGLVFFRFLRLRELDAPVALLAALAYAFSGFMILGGQWIIFTSEGLFLAILLWSVERLLRLKSAWMLALGVGLVAMSSPFNLFPFALILLPYTILELSAQHGRDFKAWGAFLVRALPAAVLGLVISAFFSVEALSMMLDSPRVATESSLAGKLSQNPMFALADPLQRMSIAARFFGNDLIGQGSNYTGWENYLEGPSLYCGIAILMLAAQGLALTPRKQALGLGIWLAISLFPLLFPYFRYGFWAFQGNYYRVFNFFVILPFIVLAAKGLQEIWKGKNPSWIALGISLVLWLFILNYPQKGKLAPNLQISREIKNLSMLLIFAYGGILVALNWSKNQGMKQMLNWSMLGLLVLELSYFGLKTTSNRPVVSKAELKEKAGYNDYTVDAVQKLRELDATSKFYRLSKNYNSGPAIHSSINDAKVQNYFGSASYHSFNQKHYIRFLAQMGVIELANESQTRWAPGVEPRPLLQTLTSHKYRLVRNAGPEVAGFGYQALFKVGDVEVYQNQNYLPLGFVYRQWLDTASLNRLEPVRRDMALLNALALPEQPALNLPKFNLDSLPALNNYTLDRLTSDVNNLRRDTVVWSSFDHKRLEGQVKVQEAGYLFFSIPYAKGWHLRLNGQDQPLEMVNIGFLGLPLEAGDYQIELYYRLPYAWTALWFSLLGLLLFAVLIFWESRKKPNIPSKA